MPIIVNLDVMLAKRKIRSKELAEVIGITEQNLSILKTGKANEVRGKATHDGDRKAFRDLMLKNSIEDFIGLANKNA